MFAWGIVSNCLDPKLGSLTNTVFTTVETGAQVYGTSKYGNFRKGNIQHSNEGLITKPVENMEIFQIFIYGWRGPYAAV